MTDAAMAEIGSVTVRVDAVITDEQYREAMGAVRAANERMDLLEAENAKLRELVRVMAYCNQYWRECDECRVNGGVGTITERAGCDALLDRMRELGIEV